MRALRYGGSIGALLGLCSCYGPGGDVTGEVRVVDSPLGSWTQALDTCQSGQHAGFFGVDLGRASDDRIFLRVVEDPIEGVAVLLRAPEGDQALVVTAESCKGLSADVVPTSTYYNEIRLLEGSLRASCLVDGRTRIEATADFEGCH